MLGALHRISGIFIKELIQMRRDKITFAMMLVLPVMQLILFGFAINMDPKHLPTKLQLEENTRFTRTIVAAMQNSGYFDFITTDESDGDPLVTGKAAFIVTIPVGFSKALINNQQPQILIEADATDPAAASNAIGNASTIINQALAHDLQRLNSQSSLKPAVDVVVHRAYNPEAITQYNIVPGLLGVILTMTSVMITAIAMTREAERGTMENLLSLPAKPVEVMLGKIFPYSIVGVVQTFVVLLAAYFLFEVPFTGSVLLLAIGVTVFVLANLALGFTFSTIARTQMEALQLTFFFFLPSILLSGFMFPFRGMPQWAQYIGELLPLTHFLRIVRGVMLKAAQIPDLVNEVYAIGAFMLFMCVVAILRYRTTLD
ncbi:ABC transporter permease [Neptunicella marina]|uniref:Transport permease protein n=2 Tax=Neptunicella marina TaxID=2125989 RepID=A0A8J6J0Y4_9ALTE|nr:ABC transporter permease [Neptunicella marina]